LGVSHRFAGSGDRASIGNLVFDCLRNRASAAFAMGDGTPRALVLRTLVAQWQMTPEQVANLADGSRHAPQPLSEAELAGLEAEIPATAPAHVKGDFPEWLEAEFDRAFGARAADQGAGGPALRRSQGEHAESRSRQGAEGAAAVRGRADLLCPLGSASRRVGPSAIRILRRNPSRQRLVRGSDEGSQLARFLRAQGRAASHRFLRGAGGKTLGSPR
jgi:16S rRNA (cytosine967-C5)-methyltransferase